MPTKFVTNPRRPAAKKSRVPMRRNYASASTADNYLRDLRPAQVAQMVREGSLAITHADIGNDYHTVTLFEDGAGGNRRRVEAKWFVPGEEWYDLSLGLRDGKVDPSTADLFLGPSGWDKREREEQTRAAAKRKGIDIDASRHYFNNPRRAPARRNPRLPLGATKYSSAYVSASPTDDPGQKVADIYRSRKGGLFIVFTVGDGTGLIVDVENNVKDEVEEYVAEMGMLKARGKGYLPSLEFIDAPGAKAPTKRKNPRRPAAKNPASGAVTIRVPASVHNEWEFHEVDTYEPDDDMPSNDSYRLEKGGFVNAWRNARKAGNVYVYMLSAPAFDYLVGRNGPIYNTLDIAESNGNRRLAASLRKLAGEVAAMKPRGNPRRKNPPKGFRIAGPAVKTMSERLRISKADAQRLKDMMDTGAPRILQAADRMMSGNGVERISGRPGLMFVNMGDTYDTTLIYDYKTNRFVVSSWGDIVERQPRRFED